MHEWKESDGLRCSKCTMGTEEKRDPVAARGSKQPGFPGCHYPWTPATLTTLYALNIVPHMHFPAALAVAQQYTFHLLTKKLPFPCLLALTTPLLELCNTHTCHTGLNPKILWDWQAPKQCGLSRDRNDRNGSWFAGISVERTDSQIKDGEHLNHRLEILLLDKTFSLEHQCSHTKEGLRNQTTTCFGYGLHTHCLEMLSALDTIYLGIFFKEFIGVCVKLR